MKSLQRSEKCNFNVELLSKTWYRDLGESIIMKTSVFQSASDNFEVSGRYEKVFETEIKVNSHGTQTSEDAGCSLQNCCVKNL